MPIPLKTLDFDFTLPEELIASVPLPRRDESRLIVVDRKSGTWEHRRFRDISELAQGYVLALNNTRVARARFFSEDGKIEILRVGILGPDRWRCMVRPGKKMRLGAQVRLGSATGTVEEILEDGNRVIQFDSPVPEQEGKLALPHYMNREMTASDEERYQTVYARQDKAAAIAAPTAGLHFTPELLAPLPHVFITLDVGVGTFQPVKADLLTEHVMHSESYEVGPQAAATLQAAPQVLAVGTTVTRVLEHQMRTHGEITAERSSTEIFIYPGQTFQRVNALLTNFHLPKSTLFMLVSAFAGTELMKAVYADAVTQRYRFYSYGDCMLLR
jgi:S-adenosylmethionine:tRNA ribosyltransferase-isomerase